MATTKEVFESASERNGEIRLALIALADGKTAEGKVLKESTVSTMRHHMKRDQRIVTLIAELSKALEDNGVHQVKLSEASLQGLNQLCYPEKGGSKVVVEEGDSILELMQKYGDVKDLKAKLEKAAEKINCVLNFKTGVVSHK